MRWRNTSSLRHRWVKAGALGAVNGSRSMLLPALVSWTTRRPDAARVWSLLAAMEIVADKTSWIPSRIAPLPLAARMLLGAAVATGMEPSRRRRSGSTFGVPVDFAIIAALSAAGSAFLLHALRVRIGGRGRAGNFLGALLEDAVAFGTGRALTRA